MSSVLGKPPKSIMDKLSLSFAQQLNFDKNIKDFVKHNHVRTLETLLDVPDEDERVKFLDLVRGLLRYVPSERLTAQMALDHDFFKT
jgi:serine/threonine protein kinase